MGMRFSMKHPLLLHFASPRSRVPQRGCGVSFALHFFLQERLRACRIPLDSTKRNRQGPESRSTGVQMGGGSRVTPALAEKFSEIFEEGYHRCRRVLFLRGGTGLGRTSCTLMVRPSTWVPFRFWIASCASDSQRLHQDCPPKPSRSFR